MTSGATPQPEYPGDHDLIDAMRRQDDAAFLVFHSRFHRLVETIAWRVAGSDVEDRRDLAQEIWLHLWQQACRWDERGSLGGFVGKSAFHKALGWVRARERRPVGPSIDELHEQGWEPKDNRDPSGRRAHDIEAMRECIEQLRQHHREAIELQQMGYSYDEVAAILARTEPMVRTDLHRGRAELGDCLKKKGVTR